MCDSIILYFVLDFSQSGTSYEAKHPEYRETYSSREKEIELTSNDCASN